MSLAPVSSFIKDFDVIGVLFFALKTINFSNTKIVADSLQFLIAFKSIASNYMTFVRQVAQERNVTAIINLLEQHSDLQNISLALGILKNLTYSFNFKGKLNLIETYLIILLILLFLNRNYIIPYQINI